MRSWLCGPTSQSGCPCRTVFLTLLLACDYWYPCRYAGTSDRVSMSILTCRAERRLRARRGLRDKPYSASRSKGLKLRVTALSGMGRSAYLCHDPVDAPVRADTL